MKEFNLAKAIEGHPLVTRDGRKVQEFHYFEKADQNGECISGVVDEEIYCWYINGHYYNLIMTDRSDLFLAPKKIKKWINIYKFKTLDNDDADYFTGIFHTIEDAKENSMIGTGFIRTIEIEFEEKE